MNPY
jgi:hypothetical protein